MRRADLASAKALENGLDPTRNYTSVSFFLPMGIGGVAATDTAPLPEVIMAEQKSSAPFFPRISPEVQKIAPNLNSEFNAQYEVEAQKWVGKAIDRILCLLKDAGLDMGDRASIIFVQAIDETYMPPIPVTGGLVCIVSVKKDGKRRDLAILPEESPMVVDVSGDEIESVTWLAQNARRFFGEDPEARLYIPKVRGGVSVQEGASSCVSDIVNDAALDWYDAAFSETDHEALVDYVRGNAIPLYDAKQRLDRGDYTGAAASAALDIAPIFDDASRMLRGPFKAALKSAKAGKAIKGAKAARMNGGMKALPEVEGAADAAAQAKHVGRKSAKAVAEGLEETRRHIQLRPLHRRLEVTRVGNSYRVKAVPVLEKQPPQEGVVVQTSGTFFGEAERLKPNMGAQPSSLRAHETGLSAPLNGLTRRLLAKSRTGKFSVQDAERLIGKKPQSKFVNEESGFVYKGFVFRGDMRRPEQIFEDGFKLRTKINSVEEVNGFRGGFGGGRDAFNIDGRGISTSPFAATADGAGADVYGRARGGYTYLVDARALEGYDLYRNAAFSRLRKTNKLDQERAAQEAARSHSRPLEVNYGTDIPHEKIVGAFDREGKYVPNPSYRFQPRPH